MVTSLLTVTLFWPEQNASWYDYTRFCDALILQFENFVLLTKFRFSDVKVNKTKQQTSALNQKNRKSQQ